MPVLTDARWVVVRGSSGPSTLIKVGLPENVAIERRVP